MHAASVRPDGRCKVSKDEEFQPWLIEHGIEDVEALVPDMAGAARGKVLPADKLGNGELKLPEALFSQTVSGDYITDENNVEDRDAVSFPGRQTPLPRFSWTATAAMAQRSRRRHVAC